MENTKISSDLEDDAELEALRVAALATLKNRSTKAVEPETFNISQIQPITRVGDNSTDLGSHKTQSSWRNNAQPLRKRGKVFPKPNQRSNLIVITPIGADKEKSRDEGRKVPQLLLPQHKWCQQVNEDSSSPRTDRHTGPSRFNRRGSGSESSDSECDDSDTSYSNDTVLQDEHSLLSLGETNDNGEKFQNGSNSERRLSFQGFESNPSEDKGNESESTSIYHYFPEKETEADKSSQNNADAFTPKETIVSESNNCNHNMKDGIPSSALSISKDDKPLCNLADSTLVHKNGESSTFNSSSKIILPKSKHTPIRFDVSDSMCQEKSKRSVDVKEKSVDRLHETSNVFKDFKNHLDSDQKSPENSKQKAASLSRNDLRFELKRKKEISVKLVSPSKYKSDAEHHTNNKRDWSRERKSHKRSRSRSYSPKRRRRKHSRSRHSSSRSSSSSSSSSLNSSRSSSPVINRSVSSVVQPVQSKIVVADTQNILKSSIGRNSHLSSSETEFFSVKKTRGIEIKLNPRPNFKISVPGKDSQNNSSEAKKRGPVHMRLGALPRKRIIQMPKAVEAAFVSTSSDDDTDVNNKCKKSNMTVVTDLSNKIVSRQSEKEWTQRSDVPKADRGKFFR